MNPLERNMLVEFKKGKKIESQTEYDLLQKVSNLGLAGFGMNYDFENDILVSEAHLTSIGKWYLRA